MMLDILFIWNIISDAKNVAVIGFGVSVDDTSAGNFLIQVAFK